MREDKTIGTEGDSEVKINKKGVTYIKNNGVILAKECTKCKEMKILDEFHNSKTNLAQRHPHCKVCVSDYGHRNRDRRRSNMEEWKKKNPDYYEKYSKANVGKIRLKNARYFQENKEEIMRKRRIYIDENKDKFREYQAKRSAMKQLLPNEVGELEAEVIFQHFDHACALTGEREGVVMDHVIPVSIGRGGTIVSNLIPLTISVNSSKHNHNIFEWFETNSEMLGIKQEKFDKVIEYLSDKNSMSKGAYRDYVDWCHANPQTIEELGGGDSALRKTTAQ